MLKRLFTGLHSFSIFVYVQKKKLQYTSLLNSNLCVRLDNRRNEPSLLLVLKWGGELTPAGRVQAEELGRAFRCMYPGGQGKKNKNKRAEWHKSLLKIIKCKMKV